MTTNLEFDVLFTPVKKLNSKKHFSERYFHSEPSAFDSEATEGANIANIHHARNLNPVINYPFIVRYSLVQFIKHQHKYDRKVKLYYKPAWYTELIRTDRILLLRFGRCGNRSELKTLRRLPSCKYTQPCYPIYDQPQRRPSSCRRRIRKSENTVDRKHTRFTVFLYQKAVG